MFSNILIVLSNILLVTSLSLSDLADLIILDNLLRHFICASMIFSLETGYRVAISVSKVFRQKLILSAIGIPINNTQVKQIKQILSISNKMKKGKTNFL